MGKFLVCWSDQTFQNFIILQSIITIDGKALILCYKTFQIRQFFDHEGSRLSEEAEFVHYYALPFVSR